MDTPNQISKLLGTSYAGNYAPGTWRLYLIGSEESTLFDADGFMYFYYPDGFPAPWGTGTDKPVILVTYRVERHTGQVSDVASDSFNIYTDSVYDATAGYEVYQFIRKSPS
jgi:Ni,Fe-hydrogenase III component G